MNQLDHRVVDENAAPQGAQGALLLAKGGAAGASAVKQRKAFGNLTNAAPLQQQQQPGGGTTGGKATARRAFGSAGPSNNGTKQAPARVAPGAENDAERASKLAEQYAAGGVERLAGHGWSRLERERACRDDRAIAESVSRMTAGLTAWGFAPPVASTSAQDDAAHLLPEPLALTPPGRCSPPGADGADCDGADAGADNDGDDLFGPPAADPASLLPELPDTSPMASDPW